MLHRFTAPALLALIATSPLSASYALETVDENLPNQTSTQRSIDAASALRFDHRLDDDVAVFATLRARALHTPASANPAVEQTIGGGLIMRSGDQHLRAEVGATEWAVPGAAPVHSGSGLVESRTEFGAMSMRAGVRRVNPYSTPVTPSGAQLYQDGAYVGASIRLASWMSLDTESRRAGGTVVDVHQTFGTPPRTSDDISGSIRASYALPSRGRDATSDGFMQVDGALHWGPSITLSASKAPLMSNLPLGVERTPRELMLGASLALSRETSVKVYGRVERLNDDAAEAAAQRVGVQFKTKF